MHQTPKNYYFVLCPLSSNYYLFFFCLSFFYIKSISLFVYNFFFYHLADQILVRDWSNLEQQDFMFAHIIFLPFVFWGVYGKKTWWYTFVWYSGCCHIKRRGASCHASASSTQKLRLYCTFGLCVSACLCGCINRVYDFVCLLVIKWFYGL